MDNSQAAAKTTAERKAIAISALSNSCTKTELAEQNGVSRKFVHAQANKASFALDTAFATALPDDQVLFMLPVTKAWLIQVCLGLLLICRGSLRGVVEFMRDLLGVSISEGSVHNISQLAAQRANVVNRKQDLGGIRQGLHDELFQGSMPVLAGIDARSTYCYMLEPAEHRDADTWAIHLLDAAKQGFNPDFTVADAGKGLRAGQAIALGDTPCHGDVFHIEHQCHSLASVLANLSKGATSHRQSLETKMQVAKEQGRGQAYSKKLTLARQYEKRAHSLATHITTLAQWLGQDVLSLAGPQLAIRQELFDFLVEAMKQRESEDRRIRQLRIALQNQRDALLAFSGVLDEQLTHIAQAYDVQERHVRAACVLQRKSKTSPAYWQKWSALWAKIGHQFHAVLEAVTQAMEQITRCSSLVENFNSRLRTYFTLRRQVGGTYLQLLQFFLNHRRFMRSRRAERVGKSPAQLLTGQEHPHWLTLLGFGPLQPLRA